MRTVRFVDAAKLEFMAEIQWYNEAGPGLGVRFSQAVEAATARALIFPQSGSPAGVRMRRVVLKGFPYSVYYQADEHGILVFAVAHHARRPDYWVKRNNT